MAGNTNQSTALIVKDKGGLKELLDTMAGSIADVLPKHLTPARMAKMALVACSRQPKLFQCTKESIAKAVITASELGLDCSGTLGSGYLVPYYNSKISALEAQFIAGYRGLIDLARRSGQIKRIEAHLVYNHDKFRCEYGLNPKLVHMPNWEKEHTDADIKCVYAVAELTDSSKQLEVMTRRDIDKIRAISKAADSGPWKTHYGEMARKTVVRRLCKYLPLSAEMEQAFTIESDAEGNGGTIDILPTEPNRVASLTARLKENGDKPTAQNRQEGAQKDAGSDSGPPPDPKAGETGEKAATGQETAIPAEPSTENPVEVEAAMTVLWPKARKQGLTQQFLKAKLEDHGADIVAIEFGFEAGDWDKRMKKALADLQPATA